ncbi:MAG: hypothetical protein AB7O57_06565 [Hyphomicrobiaceae bacterium]
MRLLMLDWSTLALFAGMVLAVAVHGIVVSVHFPAEHRQAALRHGLGAAILWGSIAVAVAVAAVAVRLALTTIPLYAAVLAGGLAILVAPVIVRPLPDALIDSAAGLLLTAGSAALLAVLSTAL